jgi:8-oxo-dGTP pyrophosphatase MutT (NUDIX family)
MEPNNYSVKVGNLHARETADSIRTLLLDNSIDPNTISYICRPQNAPSIAFVVVTSAAAAQRVIDVVNRSTLSHRALNAYPSKRATPLKPAGTDNQDVIVRKAPVCIDIDTSNGMRAQTPATATTAHAHPHHHAAPQYPKPTVYKAAGVIPLMEKNGEPYALISYEPRNGQLKLGVLGGKADPNESPEYTAAREFSEETAGLVSIKQASDLIASATSSDVPSGKYKVFVFLLKETEYQQLPARYKAILYKPAGAEAESLHWVPLKSVLQAVKNRTGAVSWSVGDTQSTKSYDSFFPKVFSEPNVISAIVACLKRTNSGATSELLVEV